MTARDQCEICFEEQEDLFERTGGSCGQIVCTHPNMYNEGEEEKAHEKKEVEEKNENEEKDRGEKRKSIKSKSSNEKKQKTEDEDETSFPTMMEMTQSQVMAFSKLPEKTIYKIEKSIKKVETFNGQKKDCAHLSLRKKGGKTVHVVRTTGMIYKHLYENENYEETKKKNDFYIINLGEKISKNQLTYCNFNIIRK